MSGEPAASPNLTAYVDTNEFLQVRDLADVPWTDVAPGAVHVEIAVTPVVLG